MPTYDYECKKCSYVFEEFHGISEKISINCPVCSGETRRLISGGAGLIFKGSGFYITDYKNANSSPNGNKSADDKNSNETKGKVKNKEKPEKANSKEKS